MENQPVSIIESRFDAYQRRFAPEPPKRRTPTMFLVFTFSLLVIAGTVAAMAFLSQQVPDQAEEVPAPSVLPALDTDETETPGTGETASETKTPGETAPGAETSD